MQRPNNMPFSFKQQNDKEQMRRLTEKCKNLVICGSGIDGVTPECMAELEACIATDQPVPRDFLPPTSGSGKPLGPLALHLADPSNYTTTGRIKYFDPSLIPVQEWDHNIPPDNTAVIMNGKRGSGKSFCCKDFVYQRRNRCTGAYCFTRTRFNDYWQSSSGGPIPFKRVYDGVDTKVLREWMVRSEWIHDNPEEAKKENICQDDVFIFEDCAVGNNLRHAEAVEALYTNGRHMGNKKTSIISMVQRPTAMSTLERDNTEFVFLFKCPNSKVKKLYWEEYMSELPMRTAYNLLDNETWSDGEHGQRCCLVLDVRAHIPVDEKFYRCIASETPPFLLGNQQFRDEGTGGEGLCVTPRQQKETSDRNQDFASFLQAPKVSTRENSAIESFIQNL